MKNRDEYPKVVLIGMSVVVTVLIGFPMIAYICFKETTQSVHLP
jgi:hypothetical protein